MVGEDPTEALPNQPSVVEKPSTVQLVPKIVGCFWADARHGGTEQPSGVIRTANPGPFSDESQELNLATTANHSPRHARPPNQDLSCHALSLPPPAAYKEHDRRGHAARPRDARELALSGIVLCAAHAPQRTASIRNRSISHSVNPTHAAFNDRVQIDVAERTLGQRNSRGSPRGHRSASPVDGASE